MHKHKLTVHHSRIRVTPAAKAFLEDHHLTAEVYIQRHLDGDWGGCDTDDAAANDHAVRAGTRTLGSYQVGPGTLWVIADAALSTDQRVKTEGHLFQPGERYALTVLVPEDY